MVCMKVPPLYTLIRNIDEEEQLEIVVSNQNHFTMNVNGVFAPLTINTKLTIDGELELEPTPPVSACEKGNRLLIKSPPRKAVKHQRSAHRHHPYHLRPRRNGGLNPNDELMRSIVIEAKKLWDNAVDFNINNKEKWDKKFIIWMELDFIMRVCYFLFFASKSANSDQQMRAIMSKCVQEKFAKQAEYVTRYKSLKNGSKDGKECESYFEMMIDRTWDRWQQLPIDTTMEISKIVDNFLSIIRSCSDFETDFSGPVCRSWKVFTDLLKKEFGILKVEEI